jgi:hypothetical protein
MQVRHCAGVSQTDAWTHTIQRASCITANVGQEVEGRGMQVMGEHQVCAGDMAFVEALFGDPGSL